MNRIETFKKPLKLSELMKGTQFEFSGSTKENPVMDDEEIEGMFWNDDIDVDAYKNPCETSFADWKTEMTEISDGIFKKVLRTAATDATAIDLLRQRVTYHRNFYVENEDAPFDSTYLSGKADQICLPIKSGRVYLDGFLEALASMKEGEQSLFVVSYKKMFREVGCSPRIKPKADILCDIKVLKIENVGAQEEIDKLLNSNNEQEKFAELKQPVEDLLSRASDYCGKSKFEDATKLYQRALQIIEHSKTEGDEENVDKIKTVKRILMNLVICSNRNEEFNNTLMHIAHLESLGSIEKAPKALFAKGKALMRLGESEAALKFLLKAQRLNPLDQQINDTIEELKQRKKSYDEFRANFGKNLKLQ